MQSISNYTADIKSPERTYLPADYKVTDWANLEPYLKELSERKLDTKEILATWLKDLSEMEAVIGEDAAWRHIRMTQDTTNKEYEEAFIYFVSEIEPKMKPYLFTINKKLAASPFTEGLDQSQYFPYLRSVKNSIALYREENIPLQSEIALLAQQYGVVSSRMTIQHDGNEYTLQQAARFLRSPDRQLRETIYRKVAERRQEDKEQLNELFDKLLALRHQVAKNAGFDNYRDYKFRELGRFDYTIEDCFEFHQAVKEHIVPLAKQLQETRKKRLDLDSMKPWDGDAEPEGTKPLQPFENGGELTEKAIAVFKKLNPFFGNCLSKMKEIERLDLESRKGKAPGGYNCPLSESGVPFIFMNAAGTMSDLITMMHEGGHAIHSFLSHPLPLASFKEYPMEIAELASMSMELFSMEHWDEFFPDKEELKRAKLEEMDRVISVLPWIATIDKYQHWLYTNPGHSQDERTTAWLEILEEFSTDVIDWDGLEGYRKSIWQKQLHLFEVPFYYIEYGIAQLGAVAMWRQYQQNKEGALENYSNALSQGYTKTLKELYETAGIKFDFSPAYIKDLAKFLKSSLDEFGR